MATVLAAAEAWRTFGSSEVSPSTAQRHSRFALLAAMYDGTSFTTEAGKQYRTDQGLYNQTRQVSNTVKSLCDFYAAHVYQGPLSPDGEQSVEGHDAAIPLVARVSGDAAEKQLRAAFGQLWQNWHWESQLAHRVRRTNILGSLLTEIVDEPATGKIMLAPIWPGLIDDLILDSAGNVKQYALAWTVTERGPLDDTGRVTNGQTYRYRKVVDGIAFRHYRDDRLYRLDDNPYGFVPAIWDRCKLGWTDWGEPAIHGSQAASDELNELWSHADDRLHQLFTMPVFVAGSGKTETIAFEQASRSKVNVIGVAGAGSASTIDFSMGDVMSTVEKIMDALAQECPELRLYDRIRDMSQVTGPGIRRAVADVEHRVNGQAALFDPQTIKVSQMATAIGGWRISQGHWGTDLTEQQKKFAPFNLDSFKAGEMDCLILPRELVKPTFAESIADQLALEQLQDQASLEALGLPLEQIAARIAEREKRAAQAFAEQQAMVSGSFGGDQGGATA